MNYDLESVDIQKLAQSMTNGMADDKYFLWVPDWLQDAEEKEEMFSFMYIMKNKIFEIKGNKRRE